MPVIDFSPLRFESRKEPGKQSTQVSASDNFRQFSMEHAAKCLEHRDCHARSQRHSSHRPFGMNTFHNDWLRRTAGEIRELEKTFIRLKNRIYKIERNLLF
jgi:hypothetical protein